MKAIKCLALLAAAAALTPSANADVKLNELMQSNVYTIMDDLNDFPDAWVELYNSGDAPVDIQGYILGQKADPAGCDTLRHAVIPAGGYLLVYCDKADIDMHTSFRLDSGKGTVYLFDPSGAKLDEVTLKKMPAPDVAYGRSTDGDGKWGYMLTPTPGDRNEGGQSSKVLGPVVFSCEGGVWRDSQQIDLELYLPDDAPDDAQIIYTTNGREPTLTNSQVYTDPIFLSSNKVVRAKVVCEGWISIPSTCQSYIFLGRDMQIPLFSIVVNPEYLYDNAIGIFATGTQGGWHNENYFYDWRRPINLEFFDAPGSDAVINQLCETRVQGGYTRENPLKSLALYANKRFGTKRFEYEFWPVDKPGVTDNKSIILRNGGNDFGGAYVRDPLCQRVLGRNSANVDWQGYSPAIVYINGQYHGMLAIRERSNDDNIAANYNGLEDIDMFENWDELKVGDHEARRVLQDFIHGQHSLEEWASIIDIDSYCDMMALNYWIYNTDFPHNNIVMWRHRSGDDLRWRWLIKDCDFGLGTWNSNDNLTKNYTDFLNTGAEGGVGYTMWRNFIACPEAKEYLQNRMIALQGDFLNADTFSRYLDEIIAENHGEQQLSHNKWASWWNNLEYNWQFIREWTSKRGDNIPRLMQKSFGLSAPLDLYVNTDLDDETLESIHVTYCGTPLTRGTFSGKDYKDHTIVLDGDKADGIVAWEVTAGYNAPQRYEGRTLTLTLSEKTTYRINAVVDPTGIADVAVDATAAVSVNGRQVCADGAIRVYDTAGRLVAEGFDTATVAAPGIYVVHTAGPTAKVTVK